MLIVAELDYPTTNVHSLSFVGMGPMQGLHLIMHAHSERIYGTILTVRGVTPLARATIAELRRVGDDAQPSLADGGFSADFGLEVLAADGVRPLDP